MPFKTRDVNLGCVVACGMWAATFLLLVAGLVAGLIEDGISIASVSLTALGLAMSAASATATIRTYFDRVTRQMDQFFQLGQDYGAGVRAMRR